MTAGFEILAFPCNQLGGQEPGTNEGIGQFACTRFKAEYPIFDKVKCVLNIFLPSFPFFAFLFQAERNDCLSVQCTL